ncbi:MAG: hypothetical protein NTX97_11425 [Bacteroidetes bacterium]|nr:hypothetical protein [Bacteroidota bacterium]
MEIAYPQFRKYLNNRSYFKIISDKEWEEIQIIGSKNVLHRYIVNIMPDRNFLHDMTFDYKENWVAIGEEEYNLYRKNC